MDRNFRRPARDEFDASPPSEAWLFAQALLGKPIPNPASAQAEARAKREQLEWLASFSTEHAAQLRRLQSQEAEARHQRELLQWLATFSTEHERELRRLQAREAEAFDAQASWERFYEGYSASLAEWSEVDHPRNPKGTPDGGQWVGKGGGSGSAGAADKFAPTSTSGQRKVVDQHSAPAGMLELATAWHETDGLLRRTRHDIETLPAEIAFRKAEVAKGGRFAYIFSQSLEKLTKDLETAKALVPQLENQKRDLQREYTASGYDAFDYASWTPSETRVSGRGIEQVGRAVAASGSPGGVKPTGDEFEIALAATSVFQLGRAAIKRALGRASKNAPLGTPIESPTSGKQVIPGRGGRYGHLEDPPSANSGLDFTPSQKRNILSENARRNDGVLIDDKTGEVLVPGQQRRGGVPAPPNEAQVDHVYPKSKGGPNTYSNAEVRSRRNNIRKGKRIE